MGEHVVSAFAPRNIGQAAPETFFLQKAKLKRGGGGMGGGGGGVDTSMHFNATPARHHCCDS